MTSSTPRPRPIPGFTLTRDTLDHMGPLHRLAAVELVRKGKWHVVEGEPHPSRDMGGHAEPAVSL